MISFLKSEMMFLLSSHTVKDLNVTQASKVQDVG